MIGYDGGIDEIYLRCEYAWKKAHLQVTGLVAPADSYRANGIEKETQPEFWCDCFTKDMPSDIAGVGMIDATEKRRYLNEGLLIVRCFVSSKNISPLGNARRLASAVRDCFRGYTTAGGVRFHFASIDSDCPKEPKWVQVQFTAEWQFDEVRSPAS